MKYLKTFEGYGSDDLIDYVDYHIIEEIFDEHHYVDFDDALYNHPALIWDFIDNDRFVRDFENGYLENQSLEDINIDDIKEYIKKDENLTDDKKEKIREKYLENNEGENEEDLYDDDDYENMLDEFDDDEIIEIAEEDEDGYDIAYNILSGMFEGQTAKEIIDEFYGVDTEFYDKDRNSYDFKNTYDNNFNSLKKIVINYIDKDGLVDQYKKYDKENDDYVKETAAQYIDTSPKAQRNIIANNPEKAVELFELIEDKDEKHIGNEYNFQKAYIEQYIKENSEDDDNNEITIDAINNINNTFTINSELEKDYPEIIAMIKYNI